MTGPTLPAYEVILSIPHRGVADVEVCSHPVFGEPVFRKSVDTLGREDSIAYLEPRLLHQIRHENVAEIYDARSLPADASSIVEIYMRYYPEGSVLDALGSGYPFGHRQAVELVRDVLSALTHLHEEMGYLHRDVKPANILLDRERSRARLTDFGSAARLDERGQARGSLGRSPLYEPPEASHGGTDVRGDVYAAGLCLFEMVNGAFPYPELDFQTVTRRLGQGRRALPDRMYRHRPWAPRILRQVINRAIAANPARRYATAADFRRALMRHGMIDWHRTEGEGLYGAWEGEWTGLRRACRYRIESYPREGRARVSVRRQTASGGWRRVLPDAVADSGELAALLEAAFEGARVDAAHRLPI